MYGNNGELLSPEEFAEVYVHELLHTARLSHPFESTQTKDTELVKVPGDNQFVTTDVSAPTAQGNIMNYGTTVIDGVKQSETSMDKLTTGQLNLLINEIELQMSGVGLGMLGKYGTYGYYVEEVGKPLQTKE